MTRTKVIIGISMLLFFAISTTKVYAKTNCTNHPTKESHTCGSMHLETLESSECDSKNMEDVIAEMSEEEKALFFRKLYNSFKNLTKKVTRKVLPSWVDNILWNRAKSAESKYYSGIIPAKQINHVIDQWGGDNNPDVSHISTCGICNGFANYGLQGTGFEKYIPKYQDMCLSPLSPF